MLFLFEIRVAKVLLQVFHLKQLIQIYKVQKNFFPKGTVSLQFRSLRKSLVQFSIQDYFL